MKTGELVSTFQLKSPGTSLSFSPNGGTLFVGTMNGFVSKWIIEKQMLSAEWKCDDSRVMQVSASPDGQKIAVASLGWVCKIFSQPNQQTLQTLAHNSFRPMSIAFSPNGRWVVTGSDKVRVWDATKTSQPVEFVGHDGSIDAVAWSPDCERIASGASDHTVRIWDHRSQTRFLSLTEGPIRPNNGSCIGSLTFSHDDRKLLTTDWSGRLRIWDLNAAEVTDQFEGSFGAVAANPVRGEHATVSYRDGRTVIWNSGDLSPIAELSNSSESTNAIAYSKDGMLLATGDVSGTVRVFELSHYSQIAEYDYGSDVRKLDFHPSGRVLAIGGWNSSDQVKARVVFWEFDGESREWFSPFPADGIHALAFNRDGDRFAVSAGSTSSRLDLVSTDTLEQIHSFRGRFLSKVSDVVFGKNDDRVISTWYDKSIRVGDVESGEETLQLNAHSRGVQAIASTQDGGTFASGGALGEVVLWESELDPLRLRRLKAAKSLPWQERMAEAAEKSGDTFAVAFHREQALTLDPEAAFRFTRLCQAVVNYETATKTRPESSTSLKILKDRIAEHRPGKIGSADEMWEVGDCLRRLQRDSSMEFYMAAVHKDMKGEIATNPLAQARLVWLINEIESGSLGGELANLKSLLPPNFDHESCVITSDHVGSNEFNQMARTFWDLGFSTVDFEAREENARFEIAASFQPNWKADLASTIYWNYPKQSMQLLKDKVLLREREGFETVRESEVRIEDETFTTVLLHRTNERWSQLQDARKLADVVRSSILARRATTTDDQSLTDLLVAYRRFRLREFGSPLGLAYFRRGEFQTAVDILSEVSKEQPPSESYSICDNLVLFLAYGALDDEDAIKDSGAVLFQSVLRVDIASLEELKNLFFEYRDDIAAFAESDEQYAKAIARITSVLPEDGSTNPRE